jgi:hypothetical protein
MTETKNLTNKIEIPYKTKLQITNLIIEIVVVWKSLPLSEIVEYCKNRDKTLDEKDILEVCRTIPFNRIHTNPNSDELVGLYCYIDYSK